MISQLGRYEIIQELGRGSMGIVYKAKDPLIDRFVAIKVIDLQGLTQAEKEEYEARFIQEAKAAGRLNHRNIFTIYDMGKSGDVAYIAMEILEGQELQKIIERKQRLAIDEVLKIAIQVASGLGYAHQYGIVHRDIKPSNIMVLNDNHVKIADFGIAKIDSSLVHTHVGMILGSPYYMSPEQISTMPLDARSDIFSFGIVLYQMLTGELPFSGDDANSIMFQIVNLDPPLPSSLNSKIPDMLDIIVLKCLAKKPNERFPSANELADNLRACLEMYLGAKASLDHHLVHNKHFRFIKRIVIPGGVSPKITIGGSYFAIVAIFAFDLITQTAIQMHLLYIFPLFMISFHCERTKPINGAVLLSLLLQSITLMSYAHLTIFAKFIFAILVLPSNVVVAYVSRMARRNYLDVEHLASFDWLTGLRNRLSFESIINLEIARQKRYGGVFSFARINLDHVKKLNASKGHQAGNEALRLLANVLREHIRSADTVARLGGDEFAILMPNTRVEDCRKLCKQLSVMISNRMSIASFPVSASIGYTTYEQAPESIFEIFERTDKAIYAAKTNGDGVAVSS